MRLLLQSQLSIRARWKLTSWVAEIKPTITTAFRGGIVVFNSIRWDPILATRMRRTMSLGSLGSFAPKAPNGTELRFRNWSLKKKPEKVSPRKREKTRIMIITALSQKHLWKGRFGSKSALMGSGLMSFSWNLGRRRLKMQSFLWGCTLTENQTDASLKCKALTKNGRNTLRSRQFNCFLVNTQSLSAQPARTRDICMQCYAIGNNLITWW